MVRTLSMHTLVSFKSDNRYWKINKDPMPSFHKTTLIGESIMLIVRDTLPHRTAFKEIFKSIYKILTAYNHIRVARIFEKIRVIFPTPCKEDIKASRNVENVVPLREEREVATMVQNVTFC
jgi:hypothetical protein